MDRRAFMTTGLSVAAIGWVGPWLDCYGILSNLPVLVLVDSALAESRGHAAVEAMGDDRRIVEIGYDAGALWYARLREWPGAVRGALRPSDCFVLQTFAVAAGRTFRQVRVGARTIAFAIGAAPPTAHALAKPS